MGTEIGYQNDNDYVLRLKEFTASRKKSVSGKIIVKCFYNFSVKAVSVYLLMKMLFIVFFPTKHLDQT